MKQVLTLHDILTLERELLNLGIVGMRVNNIYDITQRCICMRLVDKDKMRHALVLESGAKLYVDQRAFKSIHDAPNGFCMKLRKHLKNKRVEEFKVVNRDRVIDMTIGEGEYAYHIICEFYASGNIILTDSDYKILMLLHKHVYDDKTRTAIGEIYPVEQATINGMFDPMKIMNNTTAWLENLRFDGKQTLRQLLSKSPLSLMSPIMVLHAISCIGMKKNKKVSLDEFRDMLPEDVVHDIMQRVDTLYNDVNTKGYIIGDDNVVPYLYNQYKDSDNVTEYDTFNAALCKYFYDKDNIFTEKKINDKIDKVDIQDKMISNIEGQISSYNEKITKQHDIIDIINENRAVLSDMIHACNQPSLRRQMPNCDDYMIDYTKKIVTVNINDNKISLNYTKTLDANIRDHYSKSKHHKKKMDRAIDVLDNRDKVKKSIEKKVKIVLKGKKKDNWFEKYNWFISSDGNMVISGKTAQQNEEIVKKHLDPKDIYVHSDKPGSGSCVIKYDNKPISDKTLDEAGSFVICHTKAWGDSIPDRAWWVNPDQVSKTPQTGEYVGHGSFIIRGKKNMLAHAPMELGLCFIFKNGDKFCDEGDKDIEYAIPMCAPYRCVKNKKFKAKILPGKQKVGKAVANVLSNMKKIGNDYERQAINDVPKDDIQRVLVTGIRFI